MSSNVIFPKFYIDRTILNSQSVGKRLVVDLLLSAKFENTAEYLGFTDSNAISVRIIEVRDKRWKQMLEKSSEFVHMIIKYSVGGIVPSFTSEARQLFLNLAYNKGLISSHTNQQLIASFREHCSIHTIEQIPSMNNVVRTETDAAGEYGLDLYVKKVLKLSDEIEHLSFFICTQYRGILDDTTTITEGKITAELILENGRVYSRTYVFYDNNDNVWTGDVHQRDGVWYKGRYNEQSTDKLKRVPYYNTKIQDFRTIEKLSMRTDNLSSLDQYKTLIDEYSIARIRNQEVYIKNKDVPVKFIKMGQQGPVFKVDKDEFLKKYSTIYKKLKKIPEHRNNIVVESRAYMIRAKPLVRSELFIPYTKNEEKKYLQVKEVGERGREFKIIDDQFLQSEGEYCYGVEVLVTDPLIESIREYKEDLQTQIKKTEEYYNECVMPQYYDSQINKFTDSFRDWYNNSEISLESIREVVFTGIEYLTDVFSNYRGREDSRLWANNNMSPITGTPAGVLYWLSFMKYLFDIFDKMYNTSQKQKYIKIEKLFDKLSERKKRRIDIIPFNISVDSESATSLLQFEKNAHATLVDENGNPLINQTYTQNAAQFAQKMERITMLKQEANRPPPAEKTSLRKMEVLQLSKIEYVTENQTGTDRRLSVDTLGDKSSTIALRFIEIKEVYEEASKRRKSE